MTMVAVFAAMNMNAQVYVGGSVGFGSAKVGGGESESTYKIVPEIGYNLNDQWAIGASLGYQKGACNFGSFDFAPGDTEIFTVNPYARYTFLNSNMVNVFIDGGLGFASVKDGGSLFQVGLRPGIALKANDKISFVAHIGFVGSRLQARSTAIAAMLSVWNSTTTTSCSVCITTSNQRF